MFTHFISVVFKIGMFMLILEAWNQNPASQNQTFAPDSKITRRWNIVQIYACSISFEFIQVTQHHTFFSHSD